MQPINARMGRSLLLRIGIACAVVGVLLCVLGVALVASRRSAEQARMDRIVTTTAGEKAALVDTELERARALALITARIPPFEELYADAGSQAAAIAAVAGPTREINNALRYVWQLYPGRFVEVGYVDRNGAENARLVRGVVARPRALSRDVRAWPSFSTGLKTPRGGVAITAPFWSPTAGERVVAATAPVAVDGHVRAWVELELATAALKRALSSDLPAGVGVQIVNRSGMTMASTGRRFTAPPLRTGADVSSSGGLRLAAHAISERSVAAGPWSLVAAAQAPSALSVALAPGQGVLLILALGALLASAVAFDRARAFADEELAAEQRARAEAERLSRIDVMTGLFNRRHAMETLEREQARSARQGAGVGVVMIDVDHFKRINDLYGHAGGDAVLVEVARRLRSGVREWDVVARVGGEEFCVIAPSLESEAAVAALGERLRLAVCERAVPMPGGAALTVSVSLGAALVHDGDGSAEHAIECADRALYAAKRRGRNRLCRFSQLDHGDLRAEQPACVSLAEALAGASDLREGITPNHSGHVAELAAAVAERLALADDSVLAVRLGGWLHDVGKIAVPDRILTKAGRLTAAEWDIMRTHPAVGATLLVNFPELTIACDAVRHHHERFDGTGYPDGLAGHDIPLEARIVAAVDAYSAMTSTRPYEPARTHEDAIAELRRCAGTHFDPRIVDTLVDVLTQVPVPIA